MDTQLSLMEGWAQKQRGEERAEAFPAWELVRMEPRKHPRGTNYSMGWIARWHQAGGRLRPGARLIAPKGDALWAALGSSTEFSDALDVDHPPFAFGSGMGWREITAAEFSEHVGDRAAAKQQVEEAQPNLRTAPPAEPPAPVASTRTMDPALLKKLAEQVRAKRAAEKESLRYERTLTEEARAFRAAYNTQRRAA
ncbi:MAG: hypothetical protein QM784_27995 [Polyangiaceae bacterium]